LRAGEIRVRMNRPATILEHRPIAGVEVTLRRQPVRQQHVVAVELDVIVRHELTRTIHRDRRAIHQKLRRDQHPPEEDRVVRRHQKVAMRPVFGERAGRDPDRPRARRIGVSRQIDAAMADPHDGPRTAQMRHHDVAWP